MKQSTFLNLLLIPLFLGLSLSVAAQTEAIVISGTSLDKKGTPTVTKTYIGEDKILTETEGKNRENTMLFDAEEEILYIINHDKKEVMQMTRQDMEDLSAMLSQQMGVLEKQLENLPAAQRDMMREKMGAMMGQQQAAEYTLEESGVAVNSWKADKYVGMANGQKESEIYLASFGELGVDAEDVEAMNKFYDLMKNFAQSMSKAVPGGSMKFLSESMPGYDKGIPVKSVLYSKGEPTHTMMVETIAEEDVPEAVFIIPADYKKKEMEGLQRQD